MSNRKVYVMPQVYRVELKHEQAILSVCTTPATDAMNGAGTGCRPSNGCKKATGGTWDNAARPS